MVATSAQGKSASDGGTLSLSVPVNGNVTVNFDGTPTSVANGVSITSWVWKSKRDADLRELFFLQLQLRDSSNSISLTVTDSNNQTSTASGTVALSFE